MKCRTETRFLQETGFLGLSDRSKDVLFIYCTIVIALLRKRWRKMVAAATLLCLAIIDVSFIYCTIVI
ncbi:hypothetical protein [Okeania sp.]|uniref:hypothetical protein n=1 Tax=Okeania sp. TaxID=3100323 RepID=UPI002B4B1582|nr:hypothetical protein [Okeania sp.]MEB3342936.1 hypothetical protein [Okeania sp.]